MAVTTYVVSTGFMYCAVVALTVFLIVKLVQLMIYTKKRNALVEKFPGIPAHFVWGTMREYPGPNEAGLEYQRQMVMDFPKMSRGWLGPFIPVLAVNHPETVKTVLKSSEPKSMWMYNFVKPWIGDGLLVSGGEKWKRNRRLLSPAFHFDILQPYQMISNRTSDAFLSKLSTLSEQGEYFEVASITSMFTLDTILQCAFSYKTDCQNMGERHPYVKSVNELIELATFRFFKPWFHNDFVYSLTSDGRRFKRHCDYVHKVAEDIIAKRRKEIENKAEELKSKRKNLDFLDILLTAEDEEGIGLSDIEIRNEVDTFLFEGYDTTSSAISWTLYSIAGHPEVQRKIQEEVDQVLEGRESDDILWEDLSRLPYLSMCLKEGMRLHCPVPIIAREITQDMQLDGLEVPKGITVLVPIYNSHHHPEFWDNSLDYVPERFLPENIEKRDPFSFIPFSAGPRNCIGQNFAMHEMKTVIARILRRFNLELDPHHTVSKLEMAVMKAENGIMMKATRRTE